MKTKSLAIVLVLAVLFLMAGSVYPGSGPPGIPSRPVVKGHPWEELNNNNGPSGSKGMVFQDSPKVLMIPIFSDFLIWIYIKDIRKGNDHQKDSVKISDKSYQIIFPW
jgi:hypothetical protein